MLVVAPLRRPASTGASMPPAKRRTSAVEHAERHHGRGEEVEAQAVPAQRGEEARSHLEADRVDEEHEAQLAHELAGALLDVHPEVAEGDAHEEDAGDAEADAAHPHRAQGQAQSRHQRQDEDRPRRGRAVEECRAHAAVVPAAVTRGPPRGPTAPRVTRSPAASGFCERSSVPAPCP